MEYIKGQPVHIDPPYEGPGEGPDHFGSYIRNISLHFCKRLFSELEPMTLWSQANNFTFALGLPFNIWNILRCKIHLWLIN
jgi:hypothetical protein